nr:ribonuclease H-like domain-containing protein [Tanacetum cinerariifolium]
MEAGSTTTTLTVKLPILNLREYDLWLMRIEQYFLMTDNSLWEVIKNGNKVLKRTVGIVKQIYEPTSVEEKLDRKNKMKARGTLLMALLNKDQLNFHFYQDAKFLMKAIEKRHGGNKESKMVQRTLLKQQYENFAATSSETLDQTFNRLGYKAASPVVESFVNSSEMLEYQENIKSRSDKGYHAVPPPYTGNYVPPKPDLMFIDEQVESESVDVVSNVASSDVKTVESKHESVDVKNKETNAILLIMKIMMVDLFPFEMVKVEFLAKLLDESQVLLRVPRKDNIYSVDLKSVVPTGCLTCLFAKATIDESNLWYGRFGHIKYKTMNKLVKGNLVRGLPSKIFENAYGCVACQKGKQHKASYKAKLVNSISKPLHMLHMDLFGPTNVKSLMKKSHCLVVTDDFSRFFRAIVIKHHNKTLYELIPLIDFMKPFGYPVTILNTKDHLSKFDGKANEGFLVRYSMVSKAMRVFNKRTRIVEETLDIRFLKNAPNVKGNKPDWLFDINSLTISINYGSVVVGRQTNGIVGTKDNIIAGQAEKKKELEQEYFVIPICTTDPLISQGPKDSAVDAEKKATEVDEVKF